MNDDCLGSKSSAASLVIKTWHVTIMCLICTVTIMKDKNIVQSDPGIILQFTSAFQTNPRISTEIGKKNFFFFTLIFIHLIYMCSD